MEPWRTIIAITGLVCFQPLMGCAVVDQYSGRAITYNLEAEQAQDQALLLNVVRAYLGVPMQFTSVSSITGSASASSNVQYSLPVNVPFRPVTNGSSIAGFPALPTWTFNGGMSGGPAFTVPVLDTKEFYDGIMAPITGQLYDLYNQGEYPRSLLFALFVQKVVMTLKSEACVPGSDHKPTSNKAGGAAAAKVKIKKRKVRGTAAIDNMQPDSTSACEFVFHNSVDNDLELDLFQALGDYLMWLGFSTEPTPTKDTFFKDVTGRNIKGLEIKVSGVSLSGGSDASNGSGSSSDSETGSKSFGFCFSPYNPDAGYYVPDDFRCKNVRLQNASTGDQTTIKEQERIKPSGTATGMIGIAKPFAERLNRIVAQDRLLNHLNENLPINFEQFGNKYVYLTFTLRSTEALIYFLGEMARRQLSPARDELPRAVLVRDIPRYAIYPPDRPCTNSDASCKPVFVLERNAIPRQENFPSVLYDGYRYTVPGYSRGGMSLFVLEIVKQLLAINSSAKSLPASNVISLVGQ